MYNLYYMYMYAAIPLTKLVFWSLTVKMLQLLPRHKLSEPLLYKTIHPGFKASYAKQNDMRPDQVIRFLGPD